VGEIPYHLHNFLFHFSNNFFVGHILRSLDIEDGASHIVI
jgi:hypothetical protein